MNDDNRHPTDEDKSREHLIREAAEFRLLDSMREGFALAKVVSHEQGTACDYRILKINQSLGRLIGITPEDAEGKTALELFPREDPSWLEALCNVAISGEPAQFEKYSPSLGKWFSIRSFCPQKDLFACFCKDITERKLAEQALRESEEKFRTIFHTSASLITITTFDEGRYVDVNDAFTTLTGYKREEVIGRTIENVGVWNDPEERKRLARRLKIEKRLHNEEITLRTKTGKLLTTLMSATFTEIAGNQVIVVSARDITDRNKAVEALRESEERYRTLFQSIDQGFCIIEVLFDANDRPKDYRFLTINPAFKEQTGLSDALGRRMRELHPQNEAYWYEIYGHIALTGESKRFVNVAKYLGNRWYEVYAFRIGLPKERKVAILFNDITERKLAEEALGRLTATLEQRVLERSQLADARAKQLQAMAVELIEAEERERRRLAELLHDDLQQLLAAARMQLRAASENLLSAAPILEYTERLIDESIAKSRHLSYEMSPPVLLHCGILDALQGMAQQMKEKFGLQVQLQVDSQQQWGHAPLKRLLFRAVQELLFNVIKHAEVKSAQLVLARTNESFTITVSDQGLGFDPDILKSNPAKSGLGIVNLRERLNAIGGDFKIDTAPGRGSRFTLVLPASLANIEDASIAALRPQVCTADITIPAIIRALFVDDHHLMRQGLIRLLAGQADIQIAGEATNGREAVDLALLLKPDVIVMDVSMPEMDGIEATRHIKAQIPEVRVIGLSVYEDERLSKLMHQAGAEAFLSKSASPTELLKAIYGQNRSERTNHASR